MTGTRSEAGERAAERLAIRALSLFASVVLAAAIGCGSRAATTAEAGAADAPAETSQPADGATLPASDSRGADEGPTQIDDAAADTAGDGAAADAVDGGTCPGAPALRVVAGSTKKICQLTGETDRELGKPTPNRTETRFNLVGTDLGSSFEHAGKLWFLFGDTLPTAAGKAAIGYAPWLDSLASTTDVDPSSCVSLAFEATTLGGATYYRPPTVPGLGQGVFDVPLGGVSTGASAYVWFSTNCMSTSVLARSDDDLHTLAKVLTFSDCQCGGSCAPNPVSPKPTADPTSCLAVDACHFVNVQPRVVPAARATGLPGYDPANPADQLVLFGSGAYRRSDVYLATVPISKIESKAAYRYFAGTDVATCAPKFVKNEVGAAPLFSTDGERAGDAACVGELSVHFDDTLGVWLAMYNCGAKIDVRAARDPWGPFTAYDAKTTVAMDPRKVGFCEFIYQANAMCDQLSDPKGGGNNGLGDGGSVYGAYAIPRYTTPTATGVRIVYTVSVHNPYNVMLMQTDLALVAP